jgi:PDZ domain-containing protein
VRRLLSVLLLVAGLGLLGRGAVPCELFGDQPRCYVALHPGPTQDALGIVQVRGERTWTPAGELLYTTVAVDDHLDPGEWVSTALSRQVRQVPREVLFPAGMAEGEVQRRNAVDMDRSQLTAAAAALRALGHEVDLEPRGAEVVETLEGLPAGGRLQPGDVIVEVDDAPAPGVDAAIDAIGGRGAGEPVTLAVRRGATTRKVRLTLVPDPEDASRAVVGAVLRDHIVLPVDVAIDAGEVGGPSAGLMFAIAVVDVLGPRDLTGGAVIAGTGTIDADGNVGAIGGIQQKILGALDRGDRRPASVFLVPAGNVDEARAAPVGRELLLVPVATLDDALRSLEDLREGRRPADALALPAP